MSFLELRQRQIRRHQAANDILGCLLTFEDDLCRALISGSQLVGQLPAARSRAQISAVVGQSAIDQFVAALGLLSQAMNTTAAGHQSLDQTRQDLRIPAMAGGDKDVLPKGAELPYDGSDRPFRASGDLQ